MMECIRKLKELDIKEINAKTKIAIKCLDDIFECRFDVIVKPRALGFAHILEREYKIDMSEWLAAYDEFHARKAEEVKLAQEAQNEDLAKDKINISLIDTTMKNKTYIRIFVVIIVLAVLFIIYKIVSDDASEMSEPVIQPQIESKTEMPLIESSESDLNVLSQNEGENPESMDSQNSIEESTDSQSAIEESTDSQNAIEESIDSPNTIEESRNEESLTSRAQIASAIAPLEATITPKDALWIGIIDLQTYTKRQISTSNAYKIKLDSDKLIRTGHSHFDIKAGDFEKQYIGGDNKYFLFTLENGLKEIKKSEFLNFNRGKEWE